MSTQKLPDFGGVQLPAWLPIAPAQGGKAEPEEEEERAAQAGEMHEEDQQHQSGETDGLPSPSYAYPFKGISFVLQNSSLWATVLLSILGSIGVGFLIFIILMTGGLYPQVVLLGSVLNGGWETWSLGLMLVFWETTMFAFFLTQIILDYARTRLYTKVFELSQLPLDQLDRVIYGSGNDCFQWGTQRVAFFALVLQMIITLPFNAIPIVGSIAYAAVNGMSLAWALHGVYFQKKGLSLLQQLQFVKANIQDYLGFGLVAWFLDSIPILSMFFFHSNIVGSALWAVEMERRQILEKNAPLDNALIDDVGMIGDDELEVLG
jgi:hypothetical protein